MSSVGRQSRRPVWRLILDLRQGVGDASLGQDPGNKVLGRDVFAG